jgi:para-nitrobenzyl esterase
MTNRTLSSSAHLARVAIGLRVIAMAAFVACGDNAGAPPASDAPPPDAAVPDAPDAGPSSPMVTTDRGGVVGAEANGVRAFLGIPYAAAPTGELRWKAPADISWTTPRVATAYGPRCFGVSLIDPSVVRSDASEDCLSLNIWAPVSAASSPVLVWLHGGGGIDGTAGSGPGGGYPGDLLARAGDVVVVTLNYRLGPFGTFAIPSADGGGNLALLDQQAALKWLQRNIAAFGGDPAKVTLAGQSAGAQAAAAHGVMPSSHGLFRALVLESGNYDLVQMQDQAVAAANTQAKAWRCADAADAACLRALPADTIVRASQLALSTPIVGGSLLPTTLRAALATGALDVPVVAGFTASEGLFFTDGPLGALPLATAADYALALQITTGPVLGPVLENVYPLSAYGDDPRTALAAVSGDVIECSTRHLIASSGAPRFAYRFAYAPSLSSPKPLQAMHTVELPFLWGTPLPWTWWDQANAGVPSTPRELELAQQLKRYWANFARALDPSPAGDSLPSWPAWSASSEGAMTFSDDATAAGALPADAQCAFWDQVFGG